MFKNTKLYSILFILSCFFLAGCAITSTNFSKITDLPTENLAP